MSTDRQRRGLIFDSDSKEIVLHFFTIEVDLQLSIYE
jgi:hypothetical protein